MKTLFLLRHAKSSWDNSTLPDIERPLNARGMRAAELIGAHLRKEKLSFDLILSSPAVRARETIDIVLRTAKMQTDLRYDQRIYEASSVTLIDVIVQIEEEKKTALLVGHNPGMEKLLEILTGEIIHVSTGTLARIELKASRWARLLESPRTLEWVVKPKDLAAVE